MSQKILVFISLFFLSSCLSLSRSSIIKHNREEEAISIISVKIIFDGKLEAKDRGINGFCRLSFHDDNVDPVKFRREEGRDSTIYLIKSDPGKIMADSLHCVDHLKNRHFDMTEWAFWAHPKHINYLGHITITYTSSDFGIGDIFALGGLMNDSSGKVDVRVEDRSDEVADFLEKNYPELKNVPIAKSFLDDITKIVPGAKPVIYQPGAPIATAAPTSTQTTNQNSAKEISNPYYMAPNQQNFLYYDPYKNQNPTTPTN
jgi:hypothetical protein